MGNRGTVIFEEGRVAVYLHWNGGPESVYGFLEETKRRMGTRWFDPDYSPARFVQVVGDFFDQDRRDGTSVGLCSVPEGELTVETIGEVRTDQGDNGVYVLVHGEVVRRIVYDRELSSADVEAERKAALAHEYAEGFREMFLKMDERCYARKAVAAG